MHNSHIKRSERSEKIKANGSERNIRGENREEAVHLLSSEAYHMDSYYWLLCR